MKCYAGYLIMQVNIMQDDEKLITVREASQLLRVNMVTLKRWERVGKVSVTRDPITNCRYYSFRDLMKIKEELIDDKNPDAND